MRQIMIVLTPENKYVNLDNFDYVKLESTGNSSRLVAVDLDTTTDVPLTSFLPNDEFLRVENNFYSAIIAGLPLLDFFET